MKRHNDSHLDHSLTDAQIAHILQRFADRAAFFIETFTLPRELGTVPCGLYGPLVGDPPIAEAEVSYERRGTRAWISRMVALPMRDQHEVTVIAGPHDGLPCVLFTAYGGPCAPQEPGDIRAQIEALEARRRELEYRGEEHDKIYAQIEALRVKRDASDAFWREHALSKV